MLRTGRRLAIDVGKARIGLAISDFHGILASPLATVNRSTDLYESIKEVLELAEEQGEIIEIYVGVPINLKGESTPSTIDSLEFVEALQSKTETEVLLIDERMTTAVANSQLRQVGKSQKDARSTIDQMAAVAILEFALSVEGKTAGQPGLRIEKWRAKYE